MTKFSVNLNKIALLRNSRGGNRPDLMGIATRCLQGGVHGITVHPRSDERHTRFDDVRDLAALLRGHPKAELNVEGNPEAPTLKLLLETRPHQATLVPDGPGQLTSDHGWNLIHDGARVAPIIKQLQAVGIRVSVFLDPDLDQVEAAARVGANRIELYTEAYARAFGSPQAASVTASYAAAARRAHALGLEVNAGHDLDLQNLGFFLAQVPHVLEVSIGHAFVCEALDHTLEGTLARYLAIVASGGLASQ